MHPDVSSPLATDRLLFVATSYGIITCIDSKDGTVLWFEEFEDGFYASPILVGQRIYLMDMTGVMRIFEAAEEFVPIGNPPLGEPSLCTPAFLDGRIYIRGTKNLYCIGGRG